MFAASTPAAASGDGDAADIDEAEWQTVERADIGEEESLDQPTVIPLHLATAGQVRLIFGRYHSANKEHKYGVSRLQLRHPSPAALYTPVLSLVRQLQQFMETAGSTSPDLASAGLWGSLRLGLASGSLAALLRFAVTTLKANDDKLALAASASGAGGAGAGAGATEGSEGDDTPLTQRTSSRLAQDALTFLEKGAKKEAALRAKTVKSATRSTSSGSAGPVSFKFDTGACTPGMNYEDGDTVVVNDSVGGAICFTNVCISEGVWEVRCHALHVHNTPHS